jgi:archaellum component FlaG (FlaF/FlaG flagellin family)
VVEATTTSVPVAQDSISVAVYWNRPYGTARPIDIPGYKDNAGGPFPYVLYGSVTNVGQQSITQPQLTVDWYMDGQSIHTTTVPVRDAQGAPLGELAAGSSADVIVVVDSESIAPQLADAQPTFGLYTA